MNLICALHWLQKAPEGQPFGFNQNPWGMAHDRYIEPDGWNTPYWPPMVAGVLLRVVCDCTRSKEVLFSSFLRSSPCLLSGELTALAPDGVSGICNIMLSQANASLRIHDTTDGRVRISPTDRCIDYFLDLRVQRENGGFSVRDPEEFPMLRNAVPGIFARFLSRGVEYLIKSKGGSVPDRKAKRPRAPRTHAQNRKHLWIPTNQTAGSQG